MQSLHVLLLASSLSQVLANIPVRYKVTLSCNESAPDYTGCLRGMTCLDGVTCTKPAVHVKPDSLFFLEPEALTLPSAGRLIPRAYSQDGKCGPQNGGLLCDPSSSVYTVGISAIAQALQLMGRKGTCCSQYGWCGNTIAHCGTGCISGCSSTPPRAGSPATSATEEPALGKPTAAPANGPTTIDGTCGAGNSNTVCGNWPKGSCCSLYGASQSGNFS